MGTALKVDLNCDLGESFGRYELGEDAEMMKQITSANIACGFHAGDPGVMVRTVSLAKQYGVAVGAHPGYPDLQGFGRRQMALTPQEIADSICYQLGALEGFVRIAGVPLVHVKPHGALYNLAAQNPETANAVAQAVCSFNPDLILVGLAGSELTRAGEVAGLRIASEGFPDRAYLAEGRLMPRSQVGAVITSPELIAENALQLIRHGVMVDGENIKIDTLCLHGDNPEALNNAQNVRRRLAEEGVEILSLVS